MQPVQTCRAHVTIKPSMHDGYSAAENVGYPVAFRVDIPAKESGKSALLVLVQCSYRVRSPSFVLETKFGMVIDLVTLLLEDVQSPSTFISPWRS